MPSRRDNTGIRPGLQTRREGFTRKRGEGEEKEWATIRRGWTGYGNTGGRGSERKAVNDTTGEERSASYYNAVTSLDLRKKLTSSGKRRGPQPAHQIWTVVH